MARYPLEAARTVRASVRESAERELAEALEAHSNSLQDAKNAATSLDLFRRSRREREGRASTPESGAALHREAAYRERVDAQERALVQALKAAAREEHRRASEARRAREALATACVEEKVIERHRERWAKGEARAAERAEELELEEFSRT